MSVKAGGEIRRLGTGSTEVRKELFETPEVKFGLGLVERIAENLRELAFRKTSSGTGASAGRHILKKSDTSCRGSEEDTPGAKHPFGGPHAGESGVGSNAGPISLYGMFVTGSAAQYRPTILPDTSDSISENLDSGWKRDGIKARFALLFAQFHDEAWPIIGQSPHGLDRLGTFHYQPRPWTALLPTGQSPAA
ncbi:hypothetical protein [Erythrobacter alti]|uniref:hypothetical protein n=1 Tax=Erythrobacter alti TaxID=1896145 RepID=UPI0030F40425